MYCPPLKSDHTSLRLLKEQCKNFKILYVEDEEKVRIQTSKMLNIFFNHIVSVQNGEEGLNQVRKNTFNLIFTDIKMPVMNGFLMIKNIREHHPYIPIIVFSAYDDKEYLLQALEYGIAGYILKPSKFQTIQNLIQKTIDKIYFIGKKEHIIKLINNFHWNIEENKLFKNNNPIKLTKHETILFHLLSSSSHSTFSSEDIEKELFDDLYTDNKRVRSLISRLKNNIGVGLIKSVYSKGYKLNLEQLC